MTASHFARVLSTEHKNTVYIITNYGRTFYTYENKRNILRSLIVLQQIFFPSLLSKTSGLGPEGDTYVDDTG